jgi:AraC-like DNA-binding protein
MTGRRSGAFVMRAAAHKLDLYPNTSSHEVNKPSKAGPRLAPWQEELAKRILIIRLDEPISISEVASLCKLSVSHFVRAFNRTVGIAPYRWLLDRRIDHAKLLLAATALPLAGIALDCGFGDQSHFTNMFVRRTGVTPRQWREQFASPGQSSRRRSLKRSNCELCHQRPASEFSGGCGAIPSLCGRVSNTVSV